ncbi:MAG: S1 RNA-binding domain-containing protein [Prevotella sp.]|jgi:predicted RNA-binding protein (virulence factor B family)
MKNDNTNARQSIRLGRYNDLKVTRMATRENPHSFKGEETFGVFLDGGNEGDILMPAKYVPEGTKIGDLVHCFVYLDQEERLIATTEHPIAQVGDFAWLECAWVNQFGAFLDWGVMKNVFCPFSEQKRKMERGQHYLVYIYIDEESYRIVATAKIDRWISNRHPEYRPNEEVDLLVWQKTPLGFKVIVDNTYAGLIYDDQIFQSVHSGDRLQGYVQQVRPDGKIDVCLQPAGRRGTTDFADTLLDWLKQHDGFCPLGDKSDPEDIKRLFKVSKKVFKRAVGDLYKRRLVTIEDKGVKLVQD